MDNKSKIKVQRQTIKIQMINQKNNYKYKNNNLKLDKA